MGLNDPALAIGLAALAAFALAVLSAVAGFGGGVLLLPVFTVLFGLRFAVSYADLSGQSHRVATDGTSALGAVTGPVGHVLASKKNDFKLKAKSGAALADQVLPALTESVALRRTYGDAGRGDADQRNLVSQSRSTGRFRSTAVTTPGA